MTNREIAERMQRKSPDYFRPFHLPHLVAWIRDRRSDDTIVCAYCGAELFSGSHHCFHMGNTDHVLPRKQYEHLAFEDSNVVPCCARCNALKAAYDANHDARYVQARDGDRLRDEQRILFVQRATEYVNTKRRERHERTWRVWKESLGGE